MLAQARQDPATKLTRRLQARWDEATKRPRRPKVHTQAHRDSSIDEDGATSHAECSPKPAKTERQICRDVPGRQPNYPKTQRQAAAALLHVSPSTHGRSDKAAATSRGAGPGTHAQACQHAGRPKLTGTKRQNCRDVTGCWPNTQGHTDPRRPGMLTQTSQDEATNLTRRPVQAPHAQQPTPQPKHTRPNPPNLPH